MTKNAMLAVALVGMVQSSYGFSFKDALKETANAIAEAAKESAKREGQAQSSTAQSDEQGQPSQGRPAENRQSQMSVLNSRDARLNPDDLQKQGMWQDPRTGLIWSRCLVAATWDGSDCTQQGRKQAGSLLEAVYAASEVRVGGYSDWRIPTPEEIDSLRDCSGDQGPGDAKTEYPGNDGRTRRTFAKCKWGGEPKLGTKEAFSTTTNWDKSSWLVSPDPERPWIVYDGVLQPYDGQQSGPLSIRVVRGGKIPAFYSQLLAQAQSFHDKQVADNKLKQQEAQQATMARAQAKQQEAAEYARLTKELQKNVKPGDRVPFGLVLEVKGDLVKLQTYEQQCTIWFNSSTCQRYEMVVAGEKWVRRDELRPIVKTKLE